MPDTTVIYPYFVIFTMLLAAGMGFPIPEEIPVVTAGGWVAHPDSGVTWWVMLPVCIAGVVIGDAFLYTIGRVWGPRLLQNRLIRTRLLPPARYNEIRENFHKYGVKILLFARLLPGIRSPIFITAGIMHLPFTKFLLADGIYAIPGVSLLFFLGFWFTDQFLEVVRRLESMRPLIVLVVLVAVGSYLVYHFFNRPVVTGDPHELPPIVEQVAETLTEIKLRVPGTGANAAPPEAPGNGPAASPSPGEPQSAPPAGSRGGRLERPARGPAGPQQEHTGPG
jgi:membrane protein DedA with SNARE-associated domain